MIANRFVQLPGLLGCGLGFKFRPMRFPRPTEARKHCAPTKVPHLLHLHDINYIRITSFFSNRREGKQYFHEYQTWTYLSSLTKVQAALFNPFLALESHSFSFSGSSSSKETSMPKHTYPCQPTVFPNESPKMPIPPLNRATSCLKKRTTHACRPCQEHKSRCSGERPQCQRCATLHINCWYSQTKREHFERLSLVSIRSSTVKLTTQNRRLGELSIEALDYKSVLQQIQPRANSDDSKLITSVLKKFATSSEHVQGWG